MALWDDITKKASVLTEKAVQQARDLSEVAKLHGQIAEAEKTANDSYNALGRLYAATHPEDYEEGFGDLIAAAAKAEELIRNLRKQIQDVKGVATCKSAVRKSARTPLSAAPAARRSPRSSLWKQKSSPEMSPLRNL